MLRSCQYHKYHVKHRCVRLNMTGHYTVSEKSMPLVFFLGKYRSVIIIWNNIFSLFNSAMKHKISWNCTYHLSSDTLLHYLVKSTGKCAALQLHIHISKNNLLMLGGVCFMSFYLPIYFMPPLPWGGGIKRCYCLTSVILSEVGHLSVTYIWPNSRTERPRKT